MTALRGKRVMEEERIAEDTGYDFFFFFLIIGMIHIYPVGFECTTSPFTRSHGEGKSPFELVCWL